MYIYIYSTYIHIYIYSLIRPHLFCAVFAGSRIIIVCHMIRHF